MMHAMQFLQPYRRTGMSRELPEPNDQPLTELFEELRKIPNNDWHARPVLTDERILELANKHEVFGFGLYAFARLVAEEAVRLEREACAKAADDVDEPGWTGYECPNTFNDGKWAAAAAIRARSQEGDGAIK
jgi:hypothetical protein